MFISLFLVMVGFGIIMPIMPFYVRYYQGNATTIGFLMSTYSVMQFMFAPFWGRLSDRIGRRPVLLIGLSGYGASFIVFGFANSSLDAVCSAHHRGYCLLRYPANGNGLCCRHHGS